jgi:NDP-sugar pyrophosphorylase family protein
MKALLLAGGFGTRMRPLTLTRPKHLLPIGNVPHIEHVFGLLQRTGVDEVVLTTSYLADAFAQTVEGAGRWGLTLDVAHEEVALGTAGAIKNAAPFLEDETFMVLNADVLTDANLNRLVAFHSEAGAEATIMLTEVEDPSAFGVVPTDDGGRVEGFIEKPPPGEAPTNLINAGVYVMEPSVLGRIPAGREHSAERALFPELVDGGSLYARRLDGYWMDVGTPDKYLRANRDALEGRLHGAEVIAVAPSAEIDPEARISSSCVGARCHVEGGAIVERSVLLDGVKVGREARVTDSIVGEGSTVGQGAEVTGAAIADGTSV